MTAAVSRRITWFVALAIAFAVRVHSPSLSDEISFNRHVRPIFHRHCIACHGGIKQAAGISFVYRETVVGDKEDDAKAVVAGDPEASELFARITAESAEDRMPPAGHGDRLRPEEIEILRRWIAAGARWEAHWAFEPLRPSDFPKVSHPDWCQSKLDYFVLNTLDARNRQPSPQADPATWLRRVTFDLIGLPPSDADLDAFLANPSFSSKAAQVDRLLAAPQFGERWAAHWLDVARYADTMGYEKDPGREIWPYRDWVIQAFNDDLAFDQFTIKQLAGDLLPDSAIGDRLATAFHRNTQANAEGGTDDEEFRVAAVIDRTNTTAQAWLGLTLGCAQCHDHPYEPITQAEYYRFLAYFNNTRDSDTNEEFPRAAIPKDPQAWPTASQLDSQIRLVRQRLAAALKPWIESDDRWRSASIVAASATGGTELQIDSAEGRTDFRTTTALTAGAQYTIECALPEGLSRLTAMRVEALPLDESSAAKIPQTGFVVSHLKLTLVPPSGGVGQELPLKYGFDDDPEPFYSAQDSLNPDFPGWSCYPKQSRKSRAIFVLAAAIECPPGSVVRLTLEHQSGSEHLLLVRRGRIWFSDEPAWSGLNDSEGLGGLQSELNSLSAQRALIESYSVPVLEELPASHARASHVFLRGSFLEPTTPVTPGTPGMITPDERPTGGTRLELARWLVGPENPLAARVAVNRVWAELFGIGLVESIENFGSSGQPTEHQALLDHLAIQFQSEFHWSLKRLLREIVLSSTYGQRPEASSADWAADPRNRLLARGPRNRLTAEMVRDQALAVSGLLSSKMYGPPVMPPQPDGLWQSAYSSETWVTSTGEDRYRRAIYTYCKRTSGYPGLLMFDAPTRDVCVVRRIATNTPTQALVTLNDEAFAELASAFGQRIAEYPADSPRRKIAWGFRRATSRVPTKEKLDALAGLFDDANRGAGPRPASTASDAWSFVAATLLNLDEALSK